MTDEPTPTRPLPDHLAAFSGWVEIPGLGWLREMIGIDPLSDGIDFWWWHDCVPLRDKSQRDSLRAIDCSTGDRHAITGGTLAGGDLTIHGGSGSIPCPDCGIHGWVRDGKWVQA